MNIKISKIYLLFVTILAGELLVSSCNLSSSKSISFQQSIDQIQEISIIDIKDKANIDTSIVIQTVDIDRAEELINDINNMKMNSPIIGEIFPPFGTSIKVLYKNGNYDVIAANSAAYYKYNSEEDGFAVYTAGVVYDKDDFYAIIDKYSSYVYDSTTNYN